MVPIAIISTVGYWLAMSLTVQKCQVASVGCPFPATVDFDLKNFTSALSSYVSGSILWSLVCNLTRFPMKVYDILEHYIYSYTI